MIQPLKTTSQNVCKIKLFLASLGLALSACQGNAPFLTDAQENDGSSDSTYDLADSEWETADTRVDSMVETREDTTTDTRQDTGVDTMRDTALDTGRDTGSETIVVDVMVDTLRDSWADPVTDTSTDVVVIRQCTDEDNSELLSCFNSCDGNDNCMRQCYGRVSDVCADAWRHMLSCAQYSHCSGEDIFCYIENCPEQYMAVFGDYHADPAISYPYGTIEIEFFTNYVRNAEDDRNDDGITRETVVFGEYGASGTDLLPEETTMVQAFAQYNEDSQLQVLQIPYAGWGNIRPINPVFLLVFNNVYLTEGSVSVGLWGEAQANLMLLDVDWDTMEIICIHAMGQGWLEITEATDLANHGSLGVAGYVELFHFGNVDGYDIRGRFDFPICDPI